MTYEETLHYLYTSIPVFQNAGPSAYKPGLGTSIALDDHLGNPHKAYKTIHVAGTNGKGSVSHLLAAILRQSGYKVGLYTSPHLVDFRERIRVNGQKIPKEYVIDFVERHRSFFETLDPSFFELTSSMAFDYFRAEKVDYAVIEVGMGGRLDSTNIITPILSIITNISLDHTQFLGDTVEKIAFEKAGIIKKDVPALVGEIDRHSVAQVFADAAVKAGTLVYFAQDEGLLKESYLMDTGEWYLDSAEYGQLFGELGGVVQFRNATTVLGAINLLNTVGVNIPTEAVREGFEHVVELTGLMGRWQVLQENLYDRRHGQRQRYRRRVGPDAGKSLLLLHASIRATGNACGRFCNKSNLPRFIGHNLRFRAGSRGKSIGASRTRRHHLYRRKHFRRGGRPTLVLEKRQIT